MAITSTQQFVSDTYIATLAPTAIFTTTCNRFKPVTFDIFNITEIEEFIETRGITSVVLHDISIAYDLIFNFNIDVTDMNFIISKLGYNFIDSDDGLAPKYHEVLTFADKMKYKIAYVDLYAPVCKKIKDSKL